MWMTSPPEFIDWIEESRKAEGWSIRELARRTKFTASYISKVLNGQRNAGKDLCIALAGVFHVTDVFVFRLGGLLESEQELDHNSEVMLGLFRNLPVDEQERVLTIMRALSTMHATAADDANGSNDTTKGE